MNNLDKSFWAGRWETGKTGWDIGYPSPELVKYIDRIQDRDISILIPGCGNAYEAEYLWQQGFRNTYVLDIAEQPLQKFAERMPEFPQSNLICANFFDISGTYDLVLEQTFFCALDPSLRESYVKQMHNILKPGGRLAGLLFTFPLTSEGPPFGGSEAEYRSLFGAHFNILQMHPATDSIAPRAGNELFFELQKS